MTDISLARLMAASNRLGEGLGEERFKTVLAKYPVRLLSVASELKLTGKAKMNSVLSAKLEVAVVTGNTNAGELANTYCVVLVMAFAA